MRFNLSSTASSFSTAAKTKRHGVPCAWFDFVNRFATLDRLATLDLFATLDRYAALEVCFDGQVGYSNRARIYWDLRGQRGVGHRTMRKMRRAMRAGLFLQLSEGRRQGAEPSGVSLTVYCLSRHCLGRHCLSRHLSRQFLDLDRF